MGGIFSNVDFMVAMGFITVLLIVMIFIFKIKEVGLIITSIVISITGIFMLYSMYEVYQDRYATNTKTSLNI